MNRRELLVGTAAVAAAAVVPELGIDQEVLLGPDMSMPASLLRNLDMVWWVDSNGEDHMWRAPWLREHGP